MQYNYDYLYFFSDVIQKQLAPKCIWIKKHSLITVLPLTEYNNNQFITIN